MSNVIAKLVPTSLLCYSERCLKKEGNNGYAYTRRMIIKSLNKNQQGMKKWAKKNLHMYYIVINIILATTNPQHES